MNHISEFLLKVQTSEISIEDYTTRTASFIQADYFVGDEINCHKINVDYMDICSNAKAANLIDNYTPDFVSIERFDDWMQPDESTIISISFDDFWKELSFEERDDLLISCVKTKASQMYKSIFTNIEEKDRLDLIPQWDKKAA